MLKGEMRKVTFVMKLLCLYYKLLMWRTHEVYIVQYHCQEYNTERLYIGARRHGQSAKNLYHINLRDL